MTKLAFFNELFDQLNQLDEYTANLYLSHYWDEKLNDWDVSLIDDQAITLLQKDLYVFQSN